MPRETFFIIQILFSITMYDILIYVFTKKTYYFVYVYGPSCYFLIFQNNFFACFGYDTKGMILKDKVDLYMK